MSFQQASPGKEVTLNALRIVAGLLFWMHGAQKLLGWFAGNQVDGLLSLIGIAGVLEFFGGALILVGLFTRPVALVLAGEMAVAYFYQHVGSAETLQAKLVPLMNSGERAALFCFIFLLLLAYGPGQFSIDGKLQGRV